MIELNDMLQKAGLDPRSVMVLRHRPTERDLRVALPTLATEHPEIYNSYQRQHGERVERALTRATHVASFIGHEAAKAVFVGLYEVTGYQRIRASQYWAMPGTKVLRDLGSRGPGDRQDPLWFDLELTPHLDRYQGRLIVAWPGPERAWWRWSDRNTIPVHAILEESALVPPMPEWREISLSWGELKLLPSSWRQAMSQWRGIYYIFDTRARLGYVGSACGTENILGRWRDYAARGDGGNRLLRARDPSGFVFSVLELLAPSLDREQVLAIESGWKRRLSTRAPHGLNDN